MLKKNLLSDSIIRSWAAYQKQVRLSRRDKSTKNIHKLRVSTQKVEALLNLANSAKSSKGSKKIITQIKNIRKKLGPLRDSHVQSKIIENLSSQNQKKLRNFFDQQRKKAKEKAVRCLGRISLKEGKNKIKK